MIYCTTCEKDQEPDSSGRCRSCNRQLVIPTEIALPSAPIRDEAPIAQIAALSVSESSRESPDVEPPEENVQEVEPAAPAAETQTAQDDKQTEAEQKTSGQEAQGSNDSAHGGRGVGGDGGSGHGENALARLIELLKDDIPTIAVVGSYRVGKSFFIGGVKDYCTEYGGYVHTFESVSEEAAAGSDGEAAIGAYVADDQNLVDEEPISVTTKVIVHLFERKSDTAKDKFPVAEFRVIDIPGEFFFEALKQKSGFDGADNARIRMLYPVIAAAQGFILLVPAQQVFNGLAKPQREVFAAPQLLQRISSHCGYIDGLLEKNDFATVMRNVLALSQAERSRQIKNQIARSSRPAMILLSQADNCFGIGTERACNGKNGSVISEQDPLLCVAKRAPILISQLNAGFMKTRIDFLTADEGGDKRQKTEPRIQYGSWSAIHWMLDQVRPPVRRGGPLAFLGLLSAPFDKYRRRSDWVLRIRERGDGEFRKLLKPH